MDMKDNMSSARHHADSTSLEARYLKAQDFLIAAMKKGDYEDFQFLESKSFISYSECVDLVVYNTKGA